MNTNFGDILKSILNERDITQLELAGKVGISPSRLNNYICGRNFPSIDILISVADYLNVSVDYLLGRNAAVLKDYQPANVAPLLDFFQKASPEFGDIHKSSVPLYNSISDPLKLFNAKTFEHAMTFSWCPSGYNEDQKSYALLVSDESMAPFLLPGDLVYIEICNITYPVIEQIGLNEVFAVKLSEKDNVGLTLRKIIFRSNICILVPINPEYPTTTIYIDKDTFNPISGRPVAILRSLRNYRNTLTDILKKH